MKEKELTLKDVVKTIDDLAAATANGFKVAKKDTDDLAESMASYSIDTQNRFDKIDQRFDGVDKRFDGINKRFNQTDKKIEDEIRSVKAEISFRLREIKEEIERLDIRIDRLLKQSTDDVMSVIEEQDKIKLRLKKLELKSS